MESDGPDCVSIDQVGWRGSGGIGALRVCWRDVRLLGLHPSVRPCLLNIPVLLYHRYSESVELCCLQPISHLPERLLVRLQLHDAPWLRWNSGPWSKWDSDHCRLKPHQTKLTPRVTFESQLPPTIGAVVFLTIFSHDPHSRLNTFQFVHNKFYTVCLLGMSRLLSWSLPLKPFAVSTLDLTLILGVLNSRVTLRRDMSEDDSLKVSESFQFRHGVAVRGLVRWLQFGLAGLG